MTNTGNGSGSEQGTPMTPTQEDLSFHAARMQRFEEDVAATRRMKLNMGYMHFSSLSATTRKSHADRHGKLFTAEEIRAFWMDPENIAGCRCSVVAVMLNKDNQPVVPAIVENAREAYEKMAARGYDWSK